MEGQRDDAFDGAGTPASTPAHDAALPAQEDDPAALEVEDRPGQTRHRGLSDAVFYAGCGALGLLPAALAGVLLVDFIGEPLLFLLAVAAATWVVTTVTLVKIAGPALRCRAIVAGGGLVSVAMCSLFLLE
jgi:hypothetical protein